jgi:hypothetical protein
LLKIAVTSTTEDSPDRALHAYILGVLLQSRFETTGLTDDLNEWMDPLRMAEASTPNNHPNIEQYVNNLALGLQPRFEQTGSMDDFNESVRTIEQLSDRHEPAKTPAD